MKFLIFLSCIVLFGEYSKAEANLSNQKSFRTYRVGATTQSYSGTDKLSFSKGSPSYGAEATVDTGGNYLRYFLRGRYNVASGSQNFLKSGTTYFSKYDYSSIEAELGLNYYPFSRKIKGANLYFWGGGNISYNSLTLSNVPSGVNVSKNENETGTGYGAGVGVEYLLSGAKGSSANSPWMIYAEAGYRDLRAPLTGQDTFEITTLGFTFGLGF